MNRQIIYIAVSALALVSQGVLADRDHYDRGHERHWGGDIHRFHERDVVLWRGGHWHHGRHDGRLGWWWIAGGLWYFYPTPVYPYPDPYRPPVVMVEQAPVTMVEQPQVAAPPPPPPAAVPAPAQYWYYCKKPAGYYPYVSECKTPWQKVPAEPPH